MKSLRSLISLLGPYRSSLILACLLIVVETSFELIIPTMMADLIDIGVANGDVEYMLQKGGEMAFCALLALASGLAYARFAANAAYGWGARIREREYEMLQRYAFSDIDRFETSSLVTRMTSDITVMQNTINKSTSEIISTFIYTNGIQKGQYSYSSAVGLFNSVINCALLVIANVTSKKISGSSLW